MAFGQNVKQHLDSWGVAPGYNVFGLWPNTRQHLVIIADAGDSMKIVAFWRDESLVAVDSTFGEAVGRIRLGKRPIFNTMGGFFIPMDHGDIYITGAFGPVRISKTK